MDRTRKQLSRTIGRALGLMALPLGLMVLPIAATAQGIFYSDPSVDTPLPDALAKTLINQVATASGRPTSDFRIGTAQAGIWSNGCLGITTDGPCTMATVPGWKVVVTDGQNRWTYHTDTNTDVRFNASESNLLRSISSQQNGQTSQSVPEPGLLLGLGMVGTIGLRLKSQRDRG
jgi:hypothetical protein